MKRASRLPQWSPHLPGMLAWFRWQMIPRLLLVIITTGVLTTLVFLHLDYYQVGSSLEQFRAGAPAPRDVLATDTIVWQDVRETDRQRQDAVKRVPTSYKYDQTALVKSLENLDRVFTLFRMKNLGTAEWEELRQFKVTDEITSVALKLPAEQLTSLHATAQGILRSNMSARIEEGNEEQALLVMDSQARSLVRNPEQAHVLGAVIRAVLRPNWVVDTLLMERRQEDARNAIQTVKRFLRRGDVIIPKGEIVSAADLTQLKDSRLLTPAPFTRLLPVAGLMLFAILSLGVYLRTFANAIYQNPRKLMLLAFLIVAALWVNMTLGGGKLEFLVGVLAISAGSMAVAGLLGIPVAIVTTLMTSVTAGLTADHPFTFMLLVVCSSLAGIMALPMIWPPRRTVPAVLGLVFVIFLLQLSLEGIRPGEGFFTATWNDLAQMALWSAAAGIGASIIAVGAIYVLARPFGITTHYRLMELTNTDEPLRRRLMDEAPGTYHSSIMVANLAEAAADAIGANALLTRVAALYHDIGKLKRPAFFIENQAPLGIENVHQRLSPRLSYLILISHVRDGVEFAKHYKLPDEVVDIIREHHGTTLAAYFYHRALNEPGQNQVSEIDFRYPGPKPSSREAAIVMLADSVQASVKALKEPTPTRIENMVNEIINNRLQDGQLANCDITLRHLRQIGDVFVRILAGLHTYSRIEYPEIKGEGTRIRVNVNSESNAAASESTVLTRGS